MGNPLTTLTLEQLRTRTSAKWRVHPPDVLPLWVAEMDVPLADSIVAALQATASNGDTGYPFGTGYAEALADFAAERWGWRFEIAASTNVPDVMRGMVAVMNLVTGPGDAVVVNSPVYHPFYSYLAHMDRRVVEAPLGADRRIDLDSLELALADAAAGGGRCALLLCNPHNPTGTVHTRAELEGAGELAAAVGARVIVDEIHAPLVYAPATHVPYLSLDVGARAFALLSASKGWNLAGLKAAVAVAGPEAVEELAQIPPQVSHGSSHIGVIAHVAALRGGGAWLDEVLVALDSSRIALGELLAQRLPEVRYEPPAGTYLAWLDCRALELGDDPAATFLQRGRVALSSGPAFGSGGAGHARLNFATSPEILTDAVARMAASL
ncbi:MAG TPA: aminotransferase class I/II-fold pyridoxal phosphate-dependent enzyme [Solirubrobacteraceae bacterium]|jgi:cystathionine beta-lyase